MADEQQDIQNYIMQHLLPNVLQVLAYLSVIIRHRLKYMREHLYTLHFWMKMTSQSYKCHKLLE